MYIRKSIIDSLSPFIAILLVVSLWQNPYLLTAILLIQSVFVLIYYRSTRALKIYLFVGIFGALSEIFVVELGAWSYPITNIMGITYWLPFLWGIVGLYIVMVTKNF